MKIDKEKINLQIVGKTGRENNLEQAKMNQKNENLEWKYSNSDVKEYVHKYNYNRGRVVDLTKFTDQEKLEYKDKVKAVIDSSYEDKKRKRPTNYKILEIMYPYFYELKRGVRNIFPKNNVESIKDLRCIDEATIRIAEREFLIVTSSAIIYNNLEKDEIKYIDCQNVSKEDIYISADGAEIKMEKGEKYITIIKDGRLIDNEQENLKWRNRHLSNKDGYSIINITISKRNMSVKVHHINMLMEYCLEVISTAIWGGASILVIDHKNGIKEDNRIGNLQLIPHRQNSKKRGSNEEHMLYSDMHCYDYAPELQLIVDLLETSRKAA